MLGENKLNYIRQDGLPIASQEGKKEGNGLYQSDEGFPCLGQTMNIVVSTTAMGSPKTLLG